MTRFALLAVFVCLGCSAPGSKATDSAGVRATDSATDTDTGDTQPSDDTGPPADATWIAESLAGIGLRAGPIVVYAVRHAERYTEGDDPSLTEEGYAHADALAERMADTPLDAIYATELVRTQQTVQPTADAHGLPIVTDIDPEAALATHILRVHGNDTVLHAGHSYTLPSFFEALGVPEVPRVSGYGQLWTVQIDRTGAVTVEESTF